MNRNVINKMVVLIIAAILVSGCGKNGQSSQYNSNDNASESRKEIFTFVDARGIKHDAEIQPGWARNDYDKSAFVRDGHKMKYSRDMDYEYRLGVDVSKYQGDINWKKVKKAGYVFAFIRIGFRGYGESGKIREDAKAIKNIKAAKEAGLDVGVYFFSQAVSEKEAKQEAKFVIKTLKNNGIKKSDLALPIVFDPENILDDDARTDDVTGEQFTRNTLAFAQVIKEAGYSPMVYSNLLWETQMLDLGRLQEIPVWYADYEDKPQTPYAFEYWQYSEKAKVPGIKEKVDVNIQMIKK